MARMPARGTSGSSGRVGKVRVNQPKPSSLRPLPNTFGKREHPKLKNDPQDVSFGSTMRKNFGSDLDD